MSQLKEAHQKLHVLTAELCRLRKQTKATRLAEIQAEAAVYRDECVRLAQKVRLQYTESAQSEDLLTGLSIQQIAGLVLQKNEEIQTLK